MRADKVNLIVQVHVDDEPILARLESAMSPQPQSVKIIVIIIIIIIINDLYISIYRKKQRRRF